ncbi:HAMP domain-containing methyl-accepting chemotaxis protein [Solibacillus sp. FSL R7-0668]|uniref:methyl-accepting chemotaxis protein n=1 Tax=Solibacillus sp. FSL R7-0668 TaxID=2921688 RepID=UPI0030FA9874
MKKTKKFIFPKISIFRRLTIKISFAIIISLLISMTLTNYITSFLSHDIQFNYGVYISTAINLVFTTVIAGVCIHWLVISPLKMLLSLTKKVSEGELNVTIPKGSRDEIGQLLDSFEVMIRNLRGIVGEINDSSGVIFTSVEKLAKHSNETDQLTQNISKSIQEVAIDTESQTNSLEKIASSIGKVNNGIKNIFKNTEKLSNLSQQTTVFASDGERTVDNAVNQMELIQNSVSESDNSIQHLSNNSKEIAQILNVITSIADQTNLLALNAAIEAARAGEAGKGFAVVAEEVRKLAIQSNDSIGQIGLLIKQIQNATETSVFTMDTVIDEVKEGIKIINDTKKKFTIISQSTIDMNLEMDDILNAARGMSLHVDEITNAIEQISTVARKNTENSNHVSTSSKEQLIAMNKLSELSFGLSKIANNLSVMTQKFDV